MNEDPDKPVPVGADDAFEPIVDSLLRYEGANQRLSPDDVPS
jgi:hypothetical protein